MSYSATVLNVMIASPSDVPRERTIARDVIADWNTVNAKDRQIVLMPVGWETHGTPEIGDRPQAIINAQMLKDADLLVAVFWTRLGSPTGVHQSGTVEEIEEHIRAKKPALIYFSSAPVPPDIIDRQQFEALQLFNESLNARGLYWKYDTPADFKEKFSRHLAQTIIAKFPSQSAHESPDTTQIADLGARIAPPDLFELLDLDEPARELLVEAGRDPQGVVLAVRTMDGLSVKTNGRNFATTGNTRDEQHWKSAVYALHRAGLLEDKTGKREVYSLTDLGYNMADVIEGRRSLL